MYGFKKISSALLLLLFISASNLYASNNWKLKKDESDIKVYSKSASGSSVQSFMGKITVKTRLSSLVSVISDSSSYPRWLYNTRSATTLADDNNGKVINYIVTNMPWPVADRDAVIFATITQNPKNKRVEINVNAKPKHIGKVKGKVRIGSLKGKWILTPINKNVVDVVYEMSINPGGKIPKWIVNEMSVDLPFHTLKNLRKISKEPGYANAKVNGIFELN